MRGADCVGLHEVLIVFFFGLGWVALETEPYAPLVQKHITKHLMEYLISNINNISSKQPLILSSFKEYIS